ncbi:ATP-binding protein [Belliella kenyensis]|uniref:ATP-binding protein n=1 Tax=Belliella kenyensis TaxID=1472724 RepID=A0ABV8ENE3_9BACT|nr:AAA family ATPase [Belliella kenyensis]MCH7403777.1 AAA family ATPase [Belliella kenyensis]MDN3602439.1 AAA family ATPase [Belliella kenyensis]
MEELINRYRNLLLSIKTDFKRSHYNKINWKGRAICILGARGTGKSTLMLQYLKENLPLDKSLYLSLDDLYFKQNSLIELTERFYQLGGRNLLLDEVHKYEDWQSAVKNMYDFYPDLKLIISGSSILALQKSQADLSRRLVYYELPELSFREYLSLKLKIKLEKYDIIEILNNHQKIVEQNVTVIPDLMLQFEHYKKTGAYPFFLEDERDYVSKINQLINVIIDYDLPEGKDISTSTQAKLKKLLYLLSTSVPFSPNITKLAEKTETTRPRLLEMLHMLEVSKLIKNLRSSSKGISMMNKPDKIFLANTNLIYALALENQNQGNIRETFFYNQLENSGAVLTTAKSGDFLVNNQFEFEIGGKNKTFDQIAKIPNSYIAADEMLYGMGNKIPLYLFGFLY